MSSEKNLLKKLLLNLLDGRLKRLEKRNIEEIKDLDHVKAENKNQNTILNQLSLKVFKKNTNKKRISFNDSLYNKSELIKHKGSQNSTKLKLYPKYYQKNIKLRNALTPTRPNNIFTLTAENWTKKRNKKYNYVKSRYMNETSNINNTNAKKYRDDRKLFLTPEPHIIKKKKIKDRINIEPKKLNRDKIDIKTRNINTVKREQDYKKKTIVSDIDLGAEEIKFVLTELKKDKERKDSNSEEESENQDKLSKNNSKSSNSSNSTSYNKDKNENKHKAKNKEILLIFGKYINSSEGDNIAILISSFLDKKTKYNFLSCSKSLISHLLFELNKIYNFIMDMNKLKSINSLDEEIINIRNKFKNEDFDSPKYSFKISDGSIRALEILDEEIYNNIFKIEELNPSLNDIIFIYRIFFQLINKEEIIEIENDKKFWQEARNYLLENNNGKIGSFIKEYISEFDFTKQNIYKLKKLSIEREDKLKPTYYENICKTTALVAFIIRDSLEYCGIIPNEKNMMPGLVINYLEYIKENLNECKEYIDFLKSYK
jgi:hypothetical protein